MKGNNSLMEWLVKLIFFLMLLPFLVSLALQALSITFQIILGFFLAMLPWLIGCAVLIGAVAGISAGLGMRWRLPRANHNRLPAGIPVVRRPREIRRREEDE